MEGNMKETFFDSKGFKILFFLLIIVIVIIVVINKEMFFETQHVGNLLEEKIMNREIN